MCGRAVKIEISAKQLVRKKRRPRMDKEWVHYMKMRALWENGWIICSSLSFYIHLNPYSSLSKYGEKGGRFRQTSTLNVPSVIKFNQSMFNPSRWKRKKNGYPIPEELIRWMRNQSRGEAGTFGRKLFKKQREGGPWEKGRHDEETGSKKSDENLVQTVGYIDC